MKTKLFLLSVIFAAIFCNVSAQVSNRSVTDSTINSLNRKISVLEHQLNEKYYTRVPREDFENLVSAKIEDKVNSKFYFWIGVILGFIGLSGAGFYSLINTQIENKVKKASEEFTKYIDESMNKRFGEINRFIEDAKNTLFNEELDKLQRRSDANITYNPSEYEKIQEKLVTLLQQAQDVKNPELPINIIDELVRNYYLNRNNKEIIDTIQKYGQRFDLKMTTLANAAIAFVDLYEYDGAVNYKELALKYCEEAFVKNPVYAEPTSMELLVYMMDFMRLESKTEKEGAKNAALLLLNKVNSGSSYYWANQTYKRLETDKKRYKIYADKLEELFPDQIAEMKHRYEEYEAKKHI